MLKKISVALLATALLTSPIFAAKHKEPVKAPAPKEQKAPEQKCGSFADLEKAAVADNAKIEYNLSGDELKKLNDFIAKKSNGQATAPAGTDRLVILSTPGTSVWLGISFVNGCAAQVFPVRPDNFKALYERSQDESI